MGMLKCFRDTFALERTEYKSLVKPEPLRATKKPGTSPLPSCCVLQVFLDIVHQNT